MLTNFLAFLLLDRLIGKCLTLFYLLSLCYMISDLPITSIPKNETISSKENGPVNIVCLNKGNPQVDKVRWYRNEKLIFEDKLKIPINDSGNSQQKSDAQTNALRILQVSRGDVGAYSCEAHNALGWGPRSNTVEVKVQCEYFRSCN